MIKQKDNLTDIIANTGLNVEQGENFNSLIGKLSEVCKLVKYYKFRDTSVKFELKKGHIYSFTVKDEENTFVYIEDTNGNIVTGVANKKLTGLRNGVIICADRCSGGGLTGKLSILNLNAYVADRWDWNDGSKQQYAPYYLKTSNTTGIDIWEL